MAYCRQSKQDAVPIETDLTLANILYEYLFEGQNVVSVQAQWKCSRHELVHIHATTSKPRRIMGALLGINRAFILAEIEGRTANAGGLVQAE